MDRRGHGVVTRKRNLRRVVMGGWGRKARRSGGRQNGPPAVCSHVGVCTVKLFHMELLVRTGACELYRVCARNHSEMRRRDDDRGRCARRQRRSSLRARATAKRPSTPSFSVDVGGSFRQCPGPRPPGRDPLVAQPGGDEAQHFQSARLSVSRGRRQRGRAQARVAPARRRSAARAERGQQSVERRPKSHEELPVARGSAR